MSGLKADEPPVKRAIFISEEENAELVLLADQLGIDPDVLAGRLMRDGLLQGARPVQNKKGAVVEFKKGE